MAQRRVSERVEWGGVTAEERRCTAKQQRAG